MSPPLQGLLNLFPTIKWLLSLEQWLACLGPSSSSWLLLVCLFAALPPDPVENCKLSCFYVNIFSPPPSSPPPPPHRMMSTATAKRRMSMIARPKSTVVNTTVDLGTQGTYTVNQYGPEVQNPTFVNEWTVGNGNQNGFEDSEIGVESLKSRIGGCVR